MNFRKILVFAAVMTLAVSGVAFATVIGTDHDLSGYGNGTQVCIYCHHPHRGPAGSIGSQLLWNIDDWSTTNFGQYTSASIDATTWDLVENWNDGFQSYGCMACHDGVISPNAIITGSNDGSTLLTSGVEITNSANLGTDLADDHPVHFEYSADLVTKDGGLKAPEGTGGGTRIVKGNISNYDYILYDNVSGMGGGGHTNTMECATCHNVHAGGTTGVTSKDASIDFLRGNTANSEICRDCHIDK